MRKAFRTLAIVFMAALCSMTLLAAAACGEEGEQQGGTTTYTLTYAAGASDATGEVPAAEKYAEGAAVTLKGADVFTRTGYTFDKWSDGTATYAAGAGFTMPAKDVTLTATWTKNAEPLPDGTEKVDSVPQGLLTTQNGTAKADWLAEYADDGVKVTAWVTDGTVYDKSESLFTNDGVEIIVAKTERATGYTEHTISAVVTAGGKSLVKNLGTDTEAEGAVIEAKYFTLDGKTLAGYRITVTVPYTLTGVTKAEEDAAICLSFTNSSSAANANVVTETTFGTEREQPHTYMALKNNAFGKNPYFEIGAFWGAGGSLGVKGEWNVMPDDGTADAYIEIDHCQADTDNNIYMYRSNEATTFYAETELTVTGVDRMSAGNYDSWPKFGVAVYSKDSAKGVFFYVDAVSNAAPPAINGDSVNVGYNVRGGGVWGSWNTINGKRVGANASCYQSEGGNENYVKLGIYRQGALFSLVLNGEVVHTLYGAGIAPDEEAYFCILSFNLRLKAKGYSLETDESALQKYYVDTEKKEEVDYLFMGDSYMDTAFFTTWKDVFGDLNAVNLGVGGTKVEYWQDQSLALLPHYVPKNVIMHIGVNNLDDNGESDQKVISRLDQLFKTLRTLWPEAKIYYISIVDNVMFHQFAAKYETVNAWVETQSDINFIDMRPHVTKTDGAADLLWFYDGLHYSAQGYALLVREICEALDLPVPTGTTSGLGDLTVGDELKYAPSAPFEVKDGIWYVRQETPLVETVLPIAGAYGANVYAEAKLSIVSDPHNAQWGKAGLSITSKTGTYYYFIDTQTVYANNQGKWDNHYGALAWRPETYGSKDWDWNNLPVHFNNSENGYTNLGNDVRFDHNVSADDFITLGVAKVGSKLYFTADGHVVGLPVQSHFGAEEEVAISVLNFNMELYAKEGYATTDLATIYEKAPAAHGSSKTIDGDLSDWTDTEKTNPFRVPVDGGRSFTVYAYMDTYGVNIYYDVVHNTHIQKAFTGTSYTHWWESTNVEFRLGGDTFNSVGPLGDGGKWLASANGQRNTDEAFFKTVKEGEKYHTVVEIFVSYVNIPGYDYSSDYVPATFGFKVEGETNSGTGFANVSEVGLWFTDQGYDWGWRGAEVTKQGIRTGTVKKIDGDLSDWSGEQFKDAQHSGFVKEAQYSGFLGEDGMYLALRVKADDIDIMSTYTQQGGGWFKNTNIEFFNSDGAAGGHWAGKVMAFGGEVFHTGYISDAGMKLDGDTLTFEIFISNRWLKDDAKAPAQSTTFNFGGRLYTAAHGVDANDTWQNYERNGVAERKG